MPEKDWWTVMNVSKTTVWAATCDDQPGAVMRKLEGLAGSGADIKFILARRLDREPNKGVLFVSPLVGERQLNAAKALGFAATRDLFAVQVEAADEPGLAYLFAGALAKEGINLRGISGMVVRGVFVACMAFDTELDADRAVVRLSQAL